MSAPLRRNVASVFWNGSTVSTSPIVISPSSMEARRPPPFWMAMSMPWSRTRSSMASATRLPIRHSRARQLARSPSMAMVASPTTFAFSSSMGPASEAMRSASASSFSMEASSRIGSPFAETTLPSSSNVTVSSPRYLP